MENNIDTNTTLNTPTPNNTQPLNNNVKTKKPLPKFFYIIAGIIFVVIILNLFGGGSMNDVVISCAKTVVSEQLKSPSSAIWHDEKIVDKDSYGRYLVHLKVEATNSFGGYVANEYLVVVCNVKKDGHFSYNTNFAMQSVNSSYYDTVVEVIKNLNNWKQPIN